MCPKVLLLTNSQSSLLSFVELAYPLLLHKMNNLKYYEERTILFPTHYYVEIVHDCALSLITC